MLLREYLRQILESLTEEEEYDLDEWIEGYGGLSEESIRILLTKANTSLQKVKTKKGQLFLFDYQNKKYIMDDDLEPSELNSWFYNVEAEDYVSIPSFHKDFWSGPAPLYHGTEEKNLDSILRDGLGPKNETRGLSNSSTGAAVFTSLSDEYVSYHYGEEAVIEVDTQTMKSDGYMPTVSQEGPIEEEQARSALAHLIGFDDYSGDVEMGIDHDTVVMFGSIPAKYLTLIILNDQRMA
jgi:hypothetical protein